MAALECVETLSANNILRRKRVIHFAPEGIVGAAIRNLSGSYKTADFLREDCDLRIDMSNMHAVGAGAFDVLVAFDVLEHVPDYRRALQEIRRVLVDDGYAILTVPQKDGLDRTFEDPSIVDATKREIAFGQWDHLRIFGADFVAIVEDIGFSVVTVDESMFTDQQVAEHVLKPPVRSAHPLATNFRKIYFCRATEP